MPRQPQYVSFTPKWWSPIADDQSRLADTPGTGFEPPSAPRLPTRILPSTIGSGLSALTLSNTISFTQRILNYVGYEVVHGIQPEFSGLQKADQFILNLAKLTIEPFEEGSFIIPASLTEEAVKVNDMTYSSTQILDRFAEVMATVEDPRTPASIGLVQAIEELGRITRREANRIEYYPAHGISRIADVIVDDRFIERVQKSKKERQSPQVVADELIGVVTAVDIVRASFNLRLENKKTTVRGKFESLIQDRMTRVLNMKVALSGVVEYRNNHPHFMRAFSLEFLEP